jgi:hypothetical protein
MSSPSPTPPPERPILPEDIYHALAPHLPLESLILLCTSIPFVRRDVAPRILAKEYPTIFKKHGKGDISRFAILVRRTKRELTNGTESWVGEQLADIGVMRLSAGVDEYARLLLHLNLETFGSRSLSRILIGAMRQEKTFALSNYTLLVKRLSVYLREKGQWDAELIWIALAEEMCKLLWQFVRHAELGNLARRVELKNDEIESIAGSLAGSYYDDYFAAAEKVQAFRDVALGKKMAPDGRLMFFGF